MFEFEITFDDQEPIVVTADMRDVARWEMGDEQGRLIGDLGGRPPVFVLYQLAFYALRRQGKFDGTMEELLDAANLVPVNGEKEIEVPKATRKGRTRTR